MNIEIPDSNLGSYAIPNECEKNTCVDIGANVGSFVKSVKDKFKLVHYYEPYGPCFEKIQKENQQDNLTGYNEAVYSEDKKQLPLVAHFNMHAGSTALKTNATNEHWTQDLDLVTTVSFKTILERIGGRINYLKVDCETSEYHLLIGNDLSAVDYIGIELHWQMGENKYNELIQHIMKTHKTNDDWSWKIESNKEVLFVNKNI